ncbi:MAG: hypothetical protein NXY57DRAFT_976135 [Lentinula lateritia]|nr:MAG: hypothetical protein NXY57DRAFT_976135 [Lentinula lateritia]
MFSLPSTQNEDSAMSLSRLQTPVSNDAVGSFSPGIMGSGTGHDLDLQNSIRSWTPSVPLGLAQTRTEFMNVNDGQLTGCSSCLQTKLEIDRLKKYVIALEHEKNCTNSNFIVLKDAYMTLAGTVPSLLSTTNALGLPAPDSVGSGGGSNGLANFDIPLKKEDFPDVSFWTRKEWTDFATRNQLQKRGRGKRGNGENVAQQYIKDEKGNAMSGERANSFRLSCRGLFSQYHAEGKAPDTWENASHEVVRHFNRCIWSTFPELRLCAENWKLHYYAINAYPGWIRNRKLSGTSIKTEDDGLGDHAAQESSPNTTLSNEQGIASSTKRSLEDDQETGSPIKKRFNFVSPLSMQGTAKTADLNVKTYASPTDTLLRSTSTHPDTISLQTGFCSNTGNFNESSNLDDISQNGDHNSSSSPLHAEQLALDPSSSTLTSSDTSTILPSATQSTNMAPVDAGPSANRGAPPVIPAGIDNVGTSIDVDRSVPIVAADVSPDGHGVPGVPVGGSGAMLNAETQSNESKKNSKAKTRTTSAGNSIVRPNTSTGMKNLCMIEFKNKHGVKATRQAFEEHWSVLDETELKRWKEASAKAKNAKKVAAAPALAT